jgi:hypothetical protein
VRGEQIQGRLNGDVVEIALALIGRAAAITTVTGPGDVSGVLQL